jgi:carbonic anhydrase
MSDSIFSCNETPLKCSQIMDIQKVYPCISCSLRLNAQIPGPGNVTKHDTGLLLNENPQTTLTINGIQHNLLQSFIYVPGAHRLPGQQDPYPLEVALYFRTDDGQKEVCLCIPVKVGASNPYFAALNTVVRDRPTIGTLVSPTGSIMSYRGADMRGRNARDSRPRTQCDPVAKVVTYYVVLTPTSISAAEYQRLQGIAKGSTGPPIAITEVIESRYKLLSRIDGIKVVNKPLPPPKDGGVDTKAMKCYRLDKDRDVVNDKVYIGGPGSTLDKELSGSQTTHSEDSRDTSIQPGDIEKWVGIIIGCAIAILIVAFIIYVVWSGTFRNYMKVQQMHDSPLPKTFGEIKPLSGLKVPAFLCPPAAATAAVTK